MAPGYQTEDNWREDPSPRHESGGRAGGPGEAHCVLGSQKPGQPSGIHGLLHSRRIRNGFFWGLGLSSTDVPWQAHSGEFPGPPGKQGHPLRLAPQSVPVLGSALSLKSVRATQGQMSGKAHAWRHAMGCH